MELYKKHRPKKLKDIYGQPATVTKLNNIFEHDNIPHSILFTGPSGCGKTTLARIVRRKLKCSKYDFHEDAPRKIDDIRLIGNRMRQAPMKGSCLVWLIDEAHKLTSDAQDEFLKMLEDTPRHVYFLLTTTDPQKLKTTVKNRCTEFAVRPLKETHIQALLQTVCKEEEVKVTQDVICKIIDNSNGSARQALVLLNAIINLESEAEMLEAILAVTSETQAFAIVQALLYKPKTSWKEMARILKATEGEEPEQIRWLVLSCCKTELLKAGHLSGRAFLIIDAFRDNFYDSKLAGLAAACYEVIEGIK